MANPIIISGYHSGYHFKANGFFLFPGYRLGTNGSERILIGRLCPCSREIFQRSPGEAQIAHWLFTMAKDTIILASGCLEGLANAIRGLWPQRWVVERAPGIQIVIQPIKGVETVQVTTPPRASPYPHHRAPVVSRPPLSPAPPWTACPWCPATAPAPAPPPPPSRREGPPPLDPYPGAGPPLHVPLFPSQEANPETGTPPPLVNITGPEIFQFLHL